VFLPNKVCKNIQSVFENSNENVLTDSKND
jgi:hypothetical protein